MNQTEIVTADSDRVQRGEGKGKETAHAKGGTRSEWT